MIQLKLLALCFLFWFGLVLSCEWDHTTDPNQGLDPNSMISGARDLGHINEVSDPESCWTACCENPDCDLVLVGRPADGGRQCVLVNCWASGYDACTLQPSTQFQVFRRKAPTTREILRVVPLVESDQTRSNETNNVRCRLPMKVGSCRAAFPRFFYDVTSQNCTSFIYGGCDANANNFESQEECEATCSGVTGSVLPDESTPAPPQAAVKAARMAPQDPTPMSKTDVSADLYTKQCEAEPQVGPCRAAMTRWFFSKEKGSCQTFIYGGCRGNMNNYRSEDKCKDTCTGVTVLPSSKKVPAEDKEPCGLSPEPGHCRAAFPKFYYDASSASCQSFLYGGCGGNANKFDSMEECMNRCSGQGSVNKHGEIRSHWTAAFFLFVTLAVMSVLLLATLIIITLRRHRLSRRSSVSDKQELLPETDDLCSLDSLTIPETPKPEPKA